MEKKRILVDEKGVTTVFIEVEITSEGDLLFTGQDIGKLPAELFGDSDYEYWLRIKEEYKDQVLLALLEHLYSGSTGLISAFREVLESKGIPCEFSSF
jgi:hypothetical protein